MENIVNEQLDALAADATPTSGSQQPDASNAPAPDTPESRKANVERWTKRILGAKKFHEKAFERMKKCQAIATKGHDKDWPEGNYVVPVLKRHINVSVSALYARNPTAVAKRKKKVQFKLWDGNFASLQQAMQTAMPRPPTPPQPPSPQNPQGAPGDPGSPGDPNAQALLQEVMEVHQNNVQLDRAGKTLEILFDYYMNEQDAGYKQQLKAAVRRTKVCGVAYSKLGFQRALEPNPDVTARIEDVTSKIATLQRLMEEAGEGEIQPDAAEMDELQLLLADLQAQPDLIVREGPVWGFPKADAIVIDPSCVHLKTLAGANWLATEYPPMTPDMIEELFKVDIGSNYKACAETGTDAKKEATDGEQQKFARVWEVQDKKSQQVFTICEGYPDFLKPPAEPDVKVSRFWTVFPLVFNEIENDDELYPTSDVWDARWMQREFNTVRQGLREHRMQNRPKYATVKGRLEQADKDKLSAGESGAVLELNALQSGEKIEELIQAVKTIAIDPNLYEVSSVFSDMERAIGSSQADLGAPSSITATQSSIIENGRSITNSDNVDDLDDWLSEMARSQGELMLLELDPQTVIEIAGPGAVWPAQTPSRADIAKDLTLDIKAGSSGRPNRGAELANMERGLPYLLQIPGVNPYPLGRRYGELLDLPVEDIVIEGMPSITAQNAVAGKGGGPTDPQAQAGAGQGNAGATNAPNPVANEPGPQAAYPAPGQAAGGAAMLAPGTKGVMATPVPEPHYQASTVQIGPPSPQRP